MKERRKISYPLNHQVQCKGVAQCLPHLSCLPVVVHAGLAVLGGVDGVSLAKLDPPPLLQRVEVPADKGVKVRVGIRCDEGAPPVNLCVRACVRACVCVCVW